MSLRTRLHLDVRTARSLDPLDHARVLTAPQVHELRTPLKLAAFEKLEHHALFPVRQALHFRRGDLPVHAREVDRNHVRLTAACTIDHQHDSIDVCHYLILPLTECTAGVRNVLHGPDTAEQTGAFLA